MCASDSVLPLARFVCMEQHVAWYEVAVPCTVRDCMLSLGFSKSTVARLFAQQALRVVPLSCNVPDALLTDIQTCSRDASWMQLNRPAAAHTAMATGNLLCVRLGLLNDDEPSCVAASCAAQADVSTSMECRSFHTQSSDSIQTPFGDIPVVYRDPFVLAVNKPQGLLVHGDGTGTPNLTGILNQNLSGLTPRHFLQPIQRLDVETSGLVLFSCYKEYQPQFDALVAGSSLTKVYLAICEGRLPSHDLTITDALARDRHDARRMRVTTQGGQHATTHMRPLAYAQGRTLVRIVLGTGRKHQIRVHCAAHGWPLVGDPLYGRTPGRMPLMLHACAEAFTHPVTGKQLKIATAWPERFSLLFNPAESHASWMHGLMDELFDV